MTSFPVLASRIRPLLLLAPLFSLPAEALTLANDQWRIELDPPPWQPRLCCHRASTLSSLPRPASAGHCIAAGGGACQLADPCRW